MSNCCKCDLFFYQIPEQDWAILSDKERCTATKLKMCPICFSLLDRKTKIYETIKHICSKIRKVRDVKHNIQVCSQ